MTIRSPKRAVKFVMIVAIVFGLGFYTYHQANRLITGPKITILEPQNGVAVATGEAIIKGQAENITFISLNDQPIFVEENGHFSQKLLLSRGYNIITLRARDKFNNETETTLELVSKAPTKSMPDFEEPATSTQATTTNNQ